MTEPDNAPFIIPQKPGATSGGRLVRIAGKALPAEHAHLVEGLMVKPPETAVAFARRPVSLTTEKIYSNDWDAFCAWCLSKSARHLPAPPTVVAAYLAERSEKFGYSRLRLNLAAIGYYHRRTGYVWVPNDPLIANVMRGILRGKHRPERPSAALLPTEIRQLLGTCLTDPPLPAGVADLRDRALLLICFASGLHRSEVAALDRRDVKMNSDGIELLIRESKGDKEGKDAKVLVVRGAHHETCPLQAMKTWLKAAAITFGPVFRNVTDAGALEARLTGNEVCQILRRRAQLAGLEIAATERMLQFGSDEFSLG